MSHEITIRADGIAEAAFNRQHAWHDLGAVIDDPAILTDADQFLAASHCDWEVGQKAVAVEGEEWVETAAGDGPQRLWLPQPGHRANVRMDTGAFLGMVSDSYKVVQNRDAFRFLTTLITDRVLEFESAFSLSGGKRVVVTARMPEIDGIKLLPGDGGRRVIDQVRRYILMGLSHDGDSAIKFGLTTVRVVCANTYAMALQDSKGKIRELSMRHSGSIEDKLDEARALIGVANGEFEQQAGVCQRLAESILTREQWEAFLDIMCPIPHAADPDFTERRAAAISETRTAIETLYLRGPLNNLPGMARTGWAALNAVTEHIDHLPRRGATLARKAEARFNVTQHGAGRDQKRRAFDTLKRLCGV